MDLPQQVIEDTLDCLEAIQDGNTDKLHQQIPDVAYRRNFFALATRLAPDCVSVTSVRITAAVPVTKCAVCFLRGTENPPAPRIAFASFFDRFVRARAAGVIKEMIPDPKGSGRSDAEHGSETRAGWDHDHGEVR